MLLTFLGLEAVNQSIKDRSHWKIRKFSSHEELRCQQIKDWQALSGAERRKAAWELVVDYWVEMKGKHPDELRLQRSVTKLIHYLGKADLISAKQTAGRPQDLADLDELRRADAI
jgi:hypothetical protein